MKKIKWSKKRRRRKKKKKKKKKSKKSRMSNLRTRVFGRDWRK